MHERETANANAWNVKEKWECCFKFRCCFDKYLLCNKGNIYTIAAVSLEFTHKMRRISISVQHEELREFNIKKNDSQNKINIILYNRNIYLFTSCPYNHFVTPQIYQTTDEDADQGQVTILNNFIYNVILSVCPHTKTTTITVSATLRGDIMLCHERNLWD